MLEASVDTAEDFPDHTDSTLIVWAKFVSTFVDWGDQILGKMPELRIMLKSLSIANLNLWCVYFVSFSIPSTPHAVLGWRVCILSCS
jgi:hypothetical protein